mmetsp:Transcript_89539/g.253770  ORF Transcript_89539/g.253770 Transcript_89539/m.253770 type:complete len:164 (-) Transcript_89539:166-657(-)
MLARLVPVALACLGPAATALEALRQRASLASPPCVTPYRSGQPRFQACCPGTAWSEAGGGFQCVPDGSSCGGAGDACGTGGPAGLSAPRGCCSGSCMRGDALAHASTVTVTCIEDRRVCAPRGSVCRIDDNEYPCCGGTQCTGNSTEALTSSTGRKVRAGYCL